MRGASFFVSSALLALSTGCIAFVEYAEGTGGAGGDGGAGASGLGGGIPSVGPGGGGTGGAACALSWSGEADPVDLLVGTVQEVGPFAVFGDRLIATARDSGGFLRVRDFALPSVTPGSLDLSFLGEPFGPVEAGGEGFDDPAYVYLGVAQLLQTCGASSGCEESAAPVPFVALERPPTSELLGLTTAGLVWLPGGLSINGFVGATPNDLGVEVLEASEAALLVQQQVPAANDTLRYCAGLERSNCTDLQLGGVRDGALAPGDRALAVDESGTLYVIVDASGQLQRYPLEAFVDVHTVTVVGDTVVVDAKTSSQSTERRLYRCCLEGIESARPEDCAAFPEVIGTPRPGGAAATDAVVLVGYADQLVRYSF